MRKYRLFGKIPVFDLVIVLIALVIAAVGIKILTSSNAAESAIDTKTQKIQYTVSVKGLSNDIEDLPMPAHTIKDGNTNSEIGKVVSAIKTENKSYDFNPVTGEKIVSVIEDRYDLIITVEANANQSERCTEINNVRIGVGKTMTFSMPSLYATGVVTSITEVK